MSASSPTAVAEIFPYLHMRGVHYGYADLDPPWAYRLERTGHHWCYVVQRGACWFEPLEQQNEALLLRAGDVLGVVHDIPHSLRDAADTGLPDSPSPLPLKPSRADNDATTTRLFVGSIPRHSDPLSEFYPTLFHVPADGSRESRRIAGFLRVIEDEIADHPGEPGSASVIQRLSELIVVEFLRVTMRRLSDINPVWLHGLGDAQVARLAAQLHRDTSRRWTSASMCRAAGLSRSALDRRFRTVLGQSAKSYLFRLRMRRAAAALAEGRKSIAEIASAIGYESEVAFHRAFRRAFGLSPGAYGRQFTDQS
jgi:AraC-like DNA-binding protein